MSTSNESRFLSRFIVSLSSELSKFSKTDFSGTCTGCCAYIVYKTLKSTKEGFEINIVPNYIERKTLLKYIPTFCFTGHDLLWIPSLQLYYDPTAMQLGFNVPAIFGPKAIPKLYNIKHGDAKNYKSIEAYAYQWGTGKGLTGEIKLKPKLKNMIYIIESIYDDCMSKWNDTDEEYRRKLIEHSISRV